MGYFGHSGSPQQHIQTSYRQLLCASEAQAGTRIAFRLQRSLIGEDERSSVSGLIFLPLGIWGLKCSAILLLISVDGYV